MLETQLLLSHYYHAKMRKTTINGFMNLQGPITSLIGRFYQKPRWIGPTCWLCTLGVHGLPPEAQHGSLEHKVFDQPVIVDSNWTFISSVYKTLCVHFSNKKFDFSILNLGYFIIYIFAILKHVKHIFKILFLIYQPSIIIFI